jgi:sugar lactone lactonase YvrE
MSDLRIAVASRNQLGECPRWHAPSQSLYWLDISAQILHRYFPATGQREETTLTERISAFAFYFTGGFLFAAGHKLVRADDNGRIYKILASADLPSDARFNDSVADAAGRFWVGALNTARRRDNHLYCFDSRDLRPVDSMIGASNGIAWSPDGLTMYLADSPRKTIWAYDFDIDAGTAQNRRIFVATTDEPGVPDGIATDKEGGVWSAYWDGWRVVRYDAAGHETTRIPMPTPRPTACAFGGERLDVLYITSASDGVPPMDAAMAGHLFTIEPGVQGTVAFNVKT